MPSTYSPSLRIELIGEGEQDGIWGQTTNNNLGDLIEQAIVGVTTVDVTAGDVTLTSFNGTVDEARSAVLVVDGTNTVTRNVIIPNEPKTYIVVNNTSQNVGIKTPSGTAFLCVSGTQTIVYCNGSDVVNGPARIYAKGPAGETSFTGTTSLGLTVAGSTSTTDYSGIDFTGNNLSIPTARIAVKTASSGSLLQFGTSGTYSSGITNTAMTINDEGDVGIGTTAPSYRLSVFDTGSDHQLWVKNTGTSASDDAIILVQTSGTGTTATIAGLYFGDADSSSSGQLRYNHNNDSMTFYTAGTLKTTITQDGWVGINKTPVTALDVNGSIYSDGVIRNTNGGSAAAPSIQPGNDADTGMYWAGNNTIGFSTAGTLKAQIADDGVIATFSNTTNYGLYSTNANASPSGIRSTYSGAAPNGTGNAFYVATDTSATRFVVRSNGGIANFSANNVNLSDRREKKDFELCGNYLEKLCQIPVQKFRYLNQAADDDAMSIGVVAQDVQAVLPELVMESDWSNGEEGSEPKMRLSIYQTDLQYVMMKAIQELKAEFDAYKATHP